MLQPAKAPHAPTSYQFSGKGEIYSYTLVTDPPASHGEYAPYWLALVKLAEGALVTAQLTDFDGEPHIGQRVEMVTRRLRTEGATGVITYGYKFRPLLLEA
jgi:uncharacterized OB-fold protein